MIYFFLRAITYKVVIVTGKQLGGSTTTANVWMILAGEIKDTGTINVPKNECEFRFQVTKWITYELPFSCCLKRCEFEFLFIFK